MKRTAIAALGAAMIATLGGGSAAQAALVNFSFGAFDGSIDHDGASLDVSTFLDLDFAFFLVQEVNPGDSSGLAAADSISIPPPGNVVQYGPGDKPSDFPTPLGGDVILKWPMAAGSGVDTFTETLTTVDTIDRKTPDEITVTLSGTLSDTAGLFMNAPAMVVMHATQDLGATFPTVTFTNEAGIVIPETSTWAMMVLGFATLGFAGFRKRLHFGRRAENVTPSA